MIYILLDIYYFKQIRKTNSKINDLIYNEFSNINNCRLITNTGNLFFISIGNENSLSPAQIINTVNSIKNTVNNYKNDLHGYNILIQILNENNINTIKQKMSSNLMNIDQDDCIWIDDSLNKLLFDFLDTEYLYSFWKIQNIKISEKETLPDSSRWLRVELYEKINYHLGKCLNFDSTGLIITGIDDIGIKDAVYSSIFNIVKKQFISFIPRLFTLFNRHSPVHPFLNSINYDFFERVPEFLFQYELPVWKNNSDIINYMVKNTFENKCYDNFIKDFYIIFNLYISAYIRMMKKHNLPAFIIIENLHSYHIDSINLLNILFHDFYKDPFFIPVLLSENDNAFKYFNKYKFNRINTRKISWKEIKNLAEFIFPGTVLPRYLCKKILDITSGNQILVKHYLYYLNKENKIKNNNGLYYFASLKEKKIVYKKNIKVIIYYLIKDFSIHQKEILYIICLLSGIFKLKGFYIFLKYLGYSEKNIDESIGLFLKYNLISVSSTIISNFNFLRTTLEKILTNDNKVIIDKVYNYIIKEWKDNNFSQQVLLFYFFIRNNYYDSALNILPDILNRKFDEMDLKNILPFLDSINKSVSIFNKRSIKNSFELIILSSYLRYYISQKNFEKAYNLVNTIEKNIDVYNHSIEKGNLLFRFSSFYYYTGKINDAISILKKSLLEIQDYGSTHDKAHIYLNMGCYFLGDGKIDESLEYLNFSENLLSYDCFEKLRCLSLKCSVLFILNKLSKIPDILNSCLNISNSIGKREWEAYIYFLFGRLEFQLGSYKKASDYFQKGLNVTILYSYDDAYSILLRWLCRSEIYSGNIHKSINILENLDTHNETYFFISEGYHFLGSNDKALFFLNKAAETKTSVIPELNEKLPWNNGFSCFEGFCLKLEKNMPILDTFITYFKAYILSLLGKSDESKNILTFISNENIPGIDLYKHEYYLFYYLSLPKYRDGDGESVNRLTLLNKATAILHEISNRIVSPSYRSDYLNKNYWNNILYTEAKKNNLA